MTDRISSFHLDVEQQIQERMQVLVQLSITRIFAKCSQRAATDPKPLALAPGPTVILSPNITVRPQQFKGCRITTRNTLFLWRLLMPLPEPMRAVLAAFRPLFTAPTWRKLMVLLTGTLVAHGRRTVATALRHTGNERETSFSTFHQVLNRARWSPLAVSRQLLGLIVETFVEAGGSLELVIDETLERRWGPKMSKRGHYRDSALSSRKRSVSSPGLRWLVMAVVVTLPWTKQRCALPFLCVLATTPAVSATDGANATRQSGGGRVKWSAWCAAGFRPCRSRGFAIPPTVSWNWACTVKSSR